MREGERRGAKCMHDYSGSVCSFSKGKCGKFPFTGGSKKRCL